MLAFTLCASLLHAQTLPAGFSSVAVSSGWNEAVGLTFNQNGSKMFVWERAGRVWVVENGQKSLLLNISEEVGGWHDHGLLGFALHPQFEANGYFYVLYLVDRHHLMKSGTSTYNAASNEYFNATIGRLTRYTATKTATGYSASNRKIFIGATKSTGIPSLSRGHVTGSIVFGTDGTLLVATGDGSTSFATDGGGTGFTHSYTAQALADGIITPKEDVGSFRSQMLESLNGKILRINPETGAGIASNPFYESANPNSVRSRVWALGLRNPFRMSLKPGTGSHYAADGNPGVFYLGDVGWMAWEEIDVMDKPGLNFGWPIFEGLEPHASTSAYASYATTKVYNYYAPNPLYGVNGCTQQYFYFQDLIKQAAFGGTASFTNPCNTSQAIPTTVKTFLHSRPLIDWKHAAAGPARTGVFSGSTAAVVNIGASGSPVSGPQFGGSSATGGVFYTGNLFPAEYKNTYFFGDYGSGWIRNMTVDASNKPKTVKNFIGNGTVVVAMANHPADGSLYYVNFGAEIRKIYYSSNQPPQAIAKADKSFGAGPLAVQFTGNTSIDPEGQPLNYEWNFGDGTALSTAANPAHTFTAAAGVPTKYTVTLKVRDNQGVTAQTTLIISVNNTPPKVVITSPVNNALYPINSPTTYNLRATVTDSEHNGSQLSYQWQTTLYHNAHNHPEPVDTKPETTTMIDPLGCDGETYFYRITLTVTDGAGLSASQEVKLYPNCGAVACSATGNITRELWNNVAGTSVSNIPLSTTPTSTTQLSSFETALNSADNYGQRIRGYICAPQTGSYTFYFASDDSGELYLSSNENPAGKQKIAFVSGYTFSKQWNKYPSQKSAAITLQANKKYYIEALHKEGGGGDHLAVGWTLPGSTSIAVVSGNYLSPFAPSSSPAACTASGTILREYWGNISGTSLAVIPVNTAPTSTLHLSSFKTTGNIADNYGQRIRGYICAPVSGNYTFYIASDDRSQLLLSTDENAANKREIASVGDWTGPEEWTKFPTQKSAPVALIAGRKYYIEALHKEGVSKDHLSVAWTLPNTASVAVIAGSYLSPYSTATARLEDGGSEETFRLKAYPNPFSGQVTLEFVSEADEELSLDLYDGRGSVIKNLFADQVQGGRVYTLSFDGNSLSGGMYVAKLTTRTRSIYQKLILIKQ